MRCTRVLVLLAVLLLGLLPSAGGVAAAETGTEPPVEIHLRIETPAYTLDASGVHVAGYAVNAAPGAPALPFWSTTVDLPLDGPWELSYASPDEQVLAVTPLPAAPAPQVMLDGPLSPAEIVDRVSQVTWTHQPDPAIYAVDAFYPGEPVQVGPEGRQRGRRLLPVRVFPFEYNPMSGMLRYHPVIEVTIRVRGASSQAPANETEAGSSRVLEEEGALRVYTGQRGMYRLTYEDLAGAGVPVSTVDPAGLAMSYLDQPVAIEVTGGDDGRFDPGDLVIFYAEPYQGRYMARNVYRLAYGSSAGDRMAQQAVTPIGNEPVITAITQTAHIEFDRTYYSTYELPRDVDHWFDTPLYANVAAPVVTTTYTLPLVAPLTAGGVSVRALLHGGFNDESVNPNQSVSVALNGHSVGLFQWQGSRLYLAEATVPAAWLQSEQNRLTLTAALTQLPGLPWYWISPDWVEVSYPALSAAVLDRLYIEGLGPSQPLISRIYLPLIIGESGGTARSPSNSASQVLATGFTADAVRIYDVRDARAPVRLTSPRVTSAGSTFTVRFRVPTADTGSYFLSTDAALLAPSVVEPDAASNWRSPDHAADTIAIVHRSLWDAIQPLLDHRAAEGLRVAKVDVQDIYDEFSAGRVDPEAIRAFLAYAYSQWNAGSEPPRYVLLVGDGHYDFKGVSRPDLPNLIPPYLLHIDPYIGETATDNRYVSVDGPDDYLPDMAIGRIPAKTSVDVQTVVAKILAYETAAPAGDWRTHTVFVADDKDNSAGNFHSYSEITRLSLPSTIDSQAIYYRADAATDTATEMRAAIRAAFDARALYLQWFGHASRQRWGSVSMFDILDPPRLAVNSALPFTAHYACWSGYFINIQNSAQYGNSEQTLGERLLLTPGRGAIADFSPSGEHIGSALVVLNQGLARAIFDSRITRIGLAVDAAKLAVFASGGAVDLIDTQILFGDPATQLQLPNPDAYSARSGPYD